MKDLITLLARRLYYLHDHKKPLDRDQSWHNKATLEDPVEHDVGNGIGLSQGGNLCPRIETASKKKLFQLLF